MFYVRLAGNYLYGKWLFTWLLLTNNDFDGVLFSHEMSLMRSGTELSQFLRAFPTYSCLNTFVMNDSHIYVRSIFHDKQNK